MDSEARNNPPNPSIRTCYTKSMVKKILHLEGLVILIASLYFYYATNGSWWLLILLLLAPDLSMIGYLKDKKLGAITYNLVHNYVLSIVLIAVGLLSQNPLIIQIGLILTAHIAMDRMLGFGLKYPTNFKDTHLQKV